MTPYKTIALIAAILALSTSISFAQVEVEVNIDVNHKVGDKTSFERSKWMNIHSSQSSSEWNDVMDKLDYLINDLDTYFGRETGHIKTKSKSVNQDPNRAGYADTVHLKTMGDADIAYYATKTDRFAYEKGNFVVANQQLPLFPNGNNPTNGGWYYSSTDTEEVPFGTASGEFCAHYFNNFYGSGGTSGFPMPKYFEIMNEPVWHFVDINHDGGGTIEEVFKFHKTVADISHKKVPGLLVGGYGTAFPDLDKGGNLKQWEERWRLFIEDYGASFDFYSLHLYDKPIWNGREVYRKGGRNEATFDLIEHFNKLTYGKVKPFLITEFGTQLWGLSDQERLWRPYNDWERIKAFSAMLMQFLERPDVFLGAIPFVIPKAEWGYDSEKDIPYRCRLLRKANEPEDYSGEWVWTEYIKFFELWSDVKGLRIDSYADDIDLQVDAYVEGNEVYLILNNIEDKAKDFNLNLKGLNDNEIESIEVKRLYFTADSNVVLDIEEVESFEGVNQLKGDETIIAKYTFKNPVDVNQSSAETKYYATTYKLPIVSKIPVTYTVSNIDKGSNGEAVLRLGLARAKSSSRFPTSIKVNGGAVLVPTNYRGDTQTDRDQFFGMLEVRVPFEYIQAGDNTIEVTFSDGGGFISSCALQVFDISRSLGREVEIPQTSVNAVNSKKLKVYPSPAKEQLTIEYISGKNCQVHIYDMQGKLLITQKIKSEVTNIDITGILPGTYFLEASGDNINSRQLFQKL